MRIVDLLKKESIQLNAAPKSKSEAIDMLVDLQVKGENISDKEEYKKVPSPVRNTAQRLWERELRYLTQKIRA